MKAFRFLLLPFSLLYGIAIIIRNIFFNTGVLKSTFFNTPIIVIGNIKAGGTGKTPFTEYLITLLQNNIQLGVLSRGYKRKSKGFLIAGEKDTSSSIGDEPFQLMSKFKNITVAVDEDRVHGISQLLKAKPETEVIILDDAFQHRFVKPGLSILLTEFSAPFFNDFLLPVGMLRENRRASKRADIIICTKSPKNLRNEEKEKFKNKLKLLNHQKVFFSSIEYKETIHLHKNKQVDLNDFNHILMVTGIANPKPFEEYLKQFAVTSKIEFKDHHSFTSNDILKVEKQFNSINENKKIIITTEKDAVRFKEIIGLPEIVETNLHYTPISFTLDQEEKKQLDKLIIDYVNKI